MDESTSPSREESPVHSIASNVDGDTKVDDKNILNSRSLNPPVHLLAELPCSTQTASFISKARREIADIIAGRDDRLLVIMGPCSIHDTEAAIQYAKRLKPLAEEFRSTLMVVMRTYFEKPRTSVGWKGLINDPHLDESFDINTGLRVARKLLLDINELGLPVAVEQLETMTPQYLADLTAWSAIGARTTESQLHRELASGLSMPVGFKNPISGSVQSAVDACLSASCPHSFLGVTKEGVPAILRSTGNPDVHVVLRGGAQGTNYDPGSISKARKILAENKLNTRILVDCSHGNSNKSFRNQKIALQSVCAQVQAGCGALAGVMVESHIYEGNQTLPKQSELVEIRNQRESAGRLTYNSKLQDTSVLEKLRFGVSVTDECIGWEETEQVLPLLQAAVEQKRRLTPQPKSVEGLPPRSRLSFDVVADGESQKSQQQVVGGC